MSQSSTMPAAAEISAAPDVPTPRPTSEIPGPARGLLGWHPHALAFFKNPVAHMETLQRDHGDVVRLVQGGNQTLLFRSQAKDCATFFAFGPENARALLTQTDVFQTRRPPGPKDPAYDQLTTNMFFINGDRHKQQRRLFMPAFHRDNLKAYYDDMVLFTRRMLDAWQPGQRIDLDHEMHRVTLNISSKTLYGIDATAREGSLAQQMSDMIFTLFSPASMIPLNLPGTPYHRLVKQMRGIVSQLETEIEAKQQAGAQGDDVLSIMIRARQDDPTSLTDDEMIGQAFTMFFAGHDTASKALTWTLFLLAQHPEVMEALQDELQRELGGEAPSYQQIYTLPVLDRVIKESLRVLTPAVIFARDVTEETQLGGYHIPAGSEVIYSPYMIHVDERIFEQPKRFDPDRWLHIKPGKYEYLPFGVGSRTCLGSSFGGMQLRLMVALIVQHCRLETVPNQTIDVQTNVVISPKGGLDMVVRPVDGKHRESRQPVQGYIRQMVDMSN